MKDIANPGLTEQESADIAEMHKIIRGSNISPEGQEFVLRVQERETRRAAIDTLSGLYNTRVLHAGLSGSYEGAERRSRQEGYAIACIDIDDFNNINNTYGHPVGDEIISLLGGMIMAITRHDDIPTRAGGDEFVILMPKTAYKGALKVGERIREDMIYRSFNLTAEKRGKLLEDGATDADVARLARLERVTVSCGVAYTSSPMGVQDLYGKADEVLYAAKAAGKNRVLGIEI
ncbi:MAG: GGDEF domain-containing protein [Candidatus Aenigmarchaeota archaeon]|nr:GGDEF domain-containing protein [Candidatus Aenigmarchaeota archaeon]